MRMLQRNGQHQAHSAATNAVKPHRAIVLSLACCIALPLLALLSLMAGAATIQAETVWQSFVKFHPDHVHHYTIREIRLPRTIMAFIVGACFAVAGAVMQGVTRNPLASPGLMGVSAGAGFAIVCAFAFLPGLGYHQLIVVSMAGSALGTLIVYGVGAAASLTTSGSYAHVKFALAGAAVGGMLGAVSQGIEIYFGVMTKVMYWYAAGVAGVKWFDVHVIAPWAAAGLVLAIALSRSITVLGLGEDVAAGLGQQVKRVKALAALAVFLLVGAAVAVSGPIGFVGLMIPHITRYLIGIDYRYVIPCSAMLGGGLLVAADSLCRIVNPPFETPVGVLTSLIGVPFFLFLARRSGRISL